MPPNALNETITECKDSRPSVQIRISPAVQKMLEVTKPDQKTYFEPEHFIERHKNTFQDESMHLERMTQGKILTKHHVAELQEKIGSLLQ